MEVLGSTNVPVIGLLVLAMCSIALAYVNKRACSRYGGPSCCAELPPIDSEIALEKQPVYISFIPSSEENKRIDNVCYTVFPLPDDSKTFILHRSRVFSDGRYETFTHILNHPKPGIIKLNKASCSYTDTVFAKVNRLKEDPSCNVMLHYRCMAQGNCARDDNELIAPVIGLTTIRRSISRSCMEAIESAVRNSGLPNQSYHVLPMKLPSRCVFNQVCTVFPALQRFQQILDISFPSLKYNNIS